MTIEKRRNLFIFLAPTLLFTLVFIAFPLFYSGYLSLSQYHYAVDAGPKFIGLKGYIDTLFHDQFFHDALINQIKFGIPYFIITFLTSLVLAILINELTRGVHFFQVIFYLPMIIPLSLVGGYGSIVGAFFGAFLMGTVRTGLVMSGAPAYWYRAFVGAILIIAAAINLKLRRQEM